MLTLKWPRTTPRLACPSDNIFLRKFILLSLTFSWKCSVFWALFFTSFIQVLTSTIVSSKIMDESYIQLVLFSQLKGFLDVDRPPFFKFQKERTSSIFTLPLCLDTYISSFMYEIFIFIIHIICGYDVRPPRNSVCLVLSMGVNFLLHHQDRANWILLAHV